jgi:hypothetical protein
MRLRQAVRAAARARGAVTTPVTTMTAVTAETAPAKAMVVVPCRVDAETAMAVARGAAGPAALSEEKQENGSAGSRAECSEAEMVARAAAGEATVPCRADATAAVAAVC